MDLVGFTSLSVGALLGAWLGFNAAEGLVALITSILGAAVGANLALLALDTAWDRQVRDRFAAKPSLKARPSTG